MFSDVLLTVDYDRTLTDTHANIPQRNLDAIRYFMENGGTFTVNSGRSLPMTQCFRDTVPVNAPLLLYTGSAWYDTVTGQLENCHLIDLDPMQVVYELQAKFPELTLEIQGVDHHYIFRKDPAWEEYIVQTGGSWAYATPDQTGPFLKFAVYGTFASTKHADMYQITPREEALFDEIIAYINRHWGDKLELFRACPRILDLHAKGVSKLRSARALQEKLGKKILVCVGDAENDLAMLEGADYAFCPSDGRVADRFPNVCSCDAGAVADVIYEKIPVLLQNRA
jgi:HAD superfamily hydrolase (TIGR01484 family)